MKKEIEFVFCNEQEAYNFSETNDLQESLDYMKKFSRRVVVTLGDKGAMYSDDKGTCKIDGLKVQSKDFTGAGDMFLGAFMHNFIKTKEVKDSLKFANFCAAKIIQVYGAKFDEEKEYLRLIE